MFGLTGASRRGREEKELIEEKEKKHMVGSSRGNSERQPLGHGRK